MEGSTSRDRDKGRKYKPGSAKRQEKAEIQKINERTK